MDPKRLFRHPRQPSWATNLNFALFVSPPDLLTTMLQERNETRSHLVLTAFEHKFLGYWWKNIYGSTIKHTTPPVNARAEICRARDGLPRGSVNINIMKSRWADLCAQQSIIENKIVWWNFIGGRNFSVNTLLQPFSCFSVLIGGELSNLWAHSLTDGWGVVKLQKKVANMISDPAFRSISRTVSKDYSNRRVYCSLMPQIEWRARSPLVP